MESFFELELKFYAPRDQAEIWLKKLRMSGQALTGIERSFIRSTYYDTHDLIIHKDLQSSLRHRMVAGKQDLTFKSEFLPFDSVLVRKETSQAVPIGSDLEAEVNRFALRHSGREHMSSCQPMFFIDVIRHTVLMAHKTAHIEVVYDRGDIRAKKDEIKTEPISEIEFELINGSLEDFFEFIAFQISGQSWVQSSASKAQRGYALVSKSERLKPRKHGAIAMQDLSPQQLFMTNMHAALHHFLDNNPVYLKNKPGAIHQTRVAIRRLRAIIRLFKDHLSYFDRKALNGELRWLQTKLGINRDWYVLYDETLAKMNFLSDQERALIKRVAQSQHEKELKKALVIYRSSRTQRLIVNIQGWLARTPISTTLSFDRLRSRAFKRNIRRFQELSDSITNFREDLQDVHAIRIIGKKFRYALEIFPALEDQKLAADLAKMQECLGVVNDIDRALSLILTHSDMKLSARTRARMQKWARIEAEHYILKAEPYLDAIVTGVSWDEDLDQADVS